MMWKCKVLLQADFVGNLDELGFESSAQPGRRAGHGEQQQVVMK